MCPIIDKWQDLNVTVEISKQHCTFSVIIMASQKLEGGVKKLSERENVLQI